jgi:glycosyltransferase involved in cell wall biosynthesis
MAPQVSVIIKSYNHAAYVGETINSILGQSLQDFELVITDDASTDGTVEVIRGFSDPRIDLKVFEKNRGISAAMNDLVARARGEFVAILNSDDFALPGRLERQVEFLRAHPDIAAVFTLPKAVDEEGNPTKGFFDFTIPFSLPDLSQASVLRQFFFHSNFLCGPTAMIRRAVYDQLGAYNPRLAILQDFDMWVRLCADHEIHIMREELTAFRVRDHNRNKSAPRRDTLLSSQFELAQILRRYRAMDADLLRKTFGDDLAAHAISSDGPPDRWLGELALTASTPAHWLFALETLSETAADDADFARLRDAIGRADIFGFQAREERDELGRAKRSMEAELHQQLAARSEYIGALEREHTARNDYIGALEREHTARGDRIVELQREIGMRDQIMAERDRRVAHLDGVIARQDGVLQTLLHSRSWRYTAPLRRLLRSMMRNRAE